MIEIGPGKGALTEAVLEQAKKVVAIEVDPYLVHYLRQKFQGALDGGRLSAEALRKQGSGNRSNAACGDARKTGGKQQRRIGCKPGQDRQDRGDGCLYTQPQ